MRSMLWLFAVASLAACGSAPSSVDGPVASDPQPTHGDEVEEEAAPPASAPADPMAQAIVAAHAARRAAHCAPPLTWSDELARVAQAWADRIGAGSCSLQHSSGPYGENLAAGTAGTLSAEQIVDMWYGEASRYDYRSASFSMQTGHFTQVVWVQSARIGCGSTTCNGMDVFVCNYDPPGNMQGGFEQNVLPTSCR